MNGGGHAVRFDDFIRFALYSDRGFYTENGGAGREADFITSPEVGPLFGLIVANYLDSVWNQLGCPSQFDVVEVGAGPGTFARAVLSSPLLCRDAIRYFAVEKSTSQRKSHPSSVISSGEFPTEPISGVVIANELLDNFPFRLMVFDAGWKEAWIIGTPAGYVEELRQVSDLPQILPEFARHGSRAPIQDEARRWVENTVSSIEKGRLLVIDYARSSTSSVVGLPWREWLRTYSNHGRGTHYLTNVGLQDITCDVMLDQVFENVDAQFTSQARFLKKYGIEVAVEEGRMYWDAHASHPDLHAMKMRSRISEAEALTDPDGLGAFTVAEVVVGD